MATPDDAGAAFRDRLDQAAWPNGKPWERPVRIGEIDYWRVHANALDRLGTVLAVFLPGGEETPTVCYLARHPHTGSCIEVSLLSGRWWDAGAGKLGRDLVSLVSHITGQTMPRAAMKLGRRAGVEARRHV